MQDVERIVAWLGEGGTGPPRGEDAHATQVCIVDSRGQLAHRKTTLPTAGDIVTALRRVAVAG